MRELDNNKMRRMLAVNSSDKDRDYILNEMSNYDLFYEFTKVFGKSRIPKKEME